MHIPQHHPCTRKEEGGKDMDRFQREAVNDESQYIQIHGGPGSGKTHVLASRIARLINNGVTPETIVALTFTHNACEALRQRVSEYLSDKTMAAQVGIHTYHMFCSNLIASHGHSVGLNPNWRMTDFIDVHNSKIMPLKSSVLESNQIYEFDRALQLGVQLVSHPEISSRYTNLLVDEFQDCDTMQFELVKAITASNPHLSLTTVGDPNQEIYQFLPGHLDRAFEKMLQCYPNTKVLGLKYNYRSQPAIVEYCERILPSFYAAEPTRTDEPGKVARLVYDRSSRLQSIVALIRSLPYKYEDIAVLTRTNAEAQEYIFMLSSSGVPVNSSLGLRGTAVKPLPNLAITLLKWTLSNNDAHLLQLLYSRFHKVLNRQKLEQAVVKVQQADGQPSGLLDFVYSSSTKTQTQFLDWLCGLKERLIQCASVNEVFDILDGAIDEWRRRASPRSVLATTVKQQIEYDMLRAIVSPPTNATVENDDPDLTVEPLYTAPGEAVNAALKLIFSHEQENGKPNKVDVLTMHAAKSKQWPVVIAPYSPLPQWMRDDNSERHLSYVTASRAMDRLYFLNGGDPHADSYLLAAPVKETVRLVQPKPLLSLSEAIKRDPLVFKPITAKRILTRVVKF